MIEACVAELVAKGELSDAQAALYRETYKELLKSLKGSMSAAAAASKATDDTMQAMQARILQRKRLAGLAYQNRKELAGAIKAATDRGVPLQKVLLAIYSHDDRVRGITTLEARRDSIRGEAQSMLASLVSRYERSLKPGGAVKHEAELIDVLRVAFGEKVESPEMTAFGRAVSETFEHQRRRFNAAGGNIRKLENWGLPTKHNPQAIFKAGYEAWRQAILPTLAPERMIDWETGQPLTGARFNKLLRDAYEGITSGGWDDRTLTARQGQALANSRQQSSPHPLPWLAGR